MRYKKDKLTAKKQDDIAIIGMACRFPGAKNYEEFWQNMVGGINSIKEITADRWDITKYYSSDRNKPNTSVSKWGGLLDQIDSFDANFFNVSPREAIEMDPQQRILLEETWHAVEDAGIKLATLQKGNTSVYVGVMATDYQQYLSSEDHQSNNYACLGNYECILANRLSYFFNLTGESQSIDAACASSLVALHNAKCSILRGESKYAIAAGVNVICHPWKYISFSKANMLSPDGQCKTFDANANGYVPGEGVGVLLMTSLKNALDNGHQIYAVLKGSSVHHNGKSRTITSPSVKLQREIVKEAIANSKITAETITYVEAHGSGTSLGDPIEVEALTQAFASKKRQYCYIGSVKTNIGHLEAAAGIAGIIKTVLMFKHRKIPKSLNIDVVNPIIDFEHSPFKIAMALTEWSLAKSIKKRRAGISSFGFGGVGSHAILEEPAQVVKKTLKHTQAIARPFMLSAKTKHSLKLLLQSWQAFIKSEAFQKQSLVDMCDTLRKCRETFSYRFGRMVRTKEEINDFIEKHIADVDILYPHFDIKNILQERYFILSLRQPIDINYSHFQKYCQTVPILKEILKEILAETAKLKGFNKLFNKKNNITTKNIQNFIILYTLSKSLIESGLHVNCIVGEGVGALVQLVLSNVLEIPETLNWLRGYSISITLKRPIMDIFDSLNHKLIRQYYITEKYCELLNNQLFIDEDIQKEIFKKAKQLIIHQYTFKKYIHEWDETFSKFKIDLKEGLEHPELLNSSDHTLMTLAFLYALKKLHQKWDLQEKIIIDNVGTNEIIDLMMDNVLSPLDAAALICKNNLDLKQIARHINQNQHRLNLHKPYFLLKKLNQTLSEISDPKQWLEQIVHQQQVTEENMLIGKEPLICTIGGDRSSLDLTNLKDSLPGLLIDLWQKGLVVDWDRWYQERGNIVALPTYEFNRSRFWFSHLSAGANKSLNPLSLTPPIKPFAVAYQAKDETIQQSTVAAKLKDSEIIEKIRSILANVLYTKIEMITLDKPFLEFGMDSILSVELITKINTEFNVNLPATKIYDHPTIIDLSSYINSQLSKKVIATTNTPAREDTSNASNIVQKSAADEPIAIIGMAGHFPKARNLTELWQLLAAGRSAITEVPLERWSIADFYSSDLTEKEKSYCKWGGFVDGVAEFDPLFFGISPAEAENMDPQQRLVLQVGWQALEDAGYTTMMLDGKFCGIHLGVMNNDYADLIARAHLPSDATQLTGNSNSILAGRVAYFLNLKGPAITIDTACSSSLVAVHLACQALRNGDADLMLAGGVTLYLFERPFVRMSRAGMLSSTGACRTFDNEADGFVPGEGCGIFVLKRLKDALKDKDLIYGVVKGNGVNQDGKTNGITAPNPESQKELELAIYEKYHINPDDISYVEAHGTGTKLGDPIEVEALTKSFEKFTDRKGYCALGSIKSNLGHTSAAAGAASLIKILLCLEHKTLVPTLNFQNANKHIDFVNSPFFVNTELKNWESPQHKPRLAAISSFGFSGTNAHAVIEEIQQRPFVSQSEKPYYLLTLSAKHPESLHQRIKDLYDWIANHENVPLEKISYTLNARRNHFSYRCAFIAATTLELKEMLHEISQGKMPINAKMQTDKKVVSNVQLEEKACQIINDLKPSLQSSSVYKENLLKLSDLYVQGANLPWELLHDHESKVSIRLPVYPFLREKYWIQETNRSKPPTTSLWQFQTIDKDKGLYQCTLIGNEFYLADHLVDDQKVLPGVVYLEMVCALTKQIYGNHMYAMALEQIVWLRPLVVSNTPVLVTICLTQKNNKHIFEIKSEIDNNLVVHCQGEINFTQKTNALIPWDNLASFDASLSQEIQRQDLYAYFKAIGLKYGPSFQTITLTKTDGKNVFTHYKLPDNLSNKTDYILHPSILDGVLQTIGVLTVTGANNGLQLPFSIGSIHLTKSLYTEFLPSEGFIYTRPALENTTSYPSYDMQVCNLDGEVLIAVKNFMTRPFRKTTNEISAEKPILQYYIPSWLPVLSLKNNVSSEIKNIVVLTDDEQFIKALRTKLTTATIIQVRLGNEYIPLHHHICQVRVSVAADYAGLLEDMLKASITPSHFILARTPDKNAQENLEYYFINDLHEPFQLLTTLMQHKVPGPLHIISAFLQNGSLTTSSMFNGFAKCIRLEHSQYHLKNLEFEGGLQSFSLYTDTIVNELLSNDNEINVRYIAGLRQVEQYTPAISAETSSLVPLRHNGIYLITGGLGGLGFLFANYLAKHYHAKLILTGRSKLDSETEKRLLQIQKNGAEVTYLTGNVADTTNVDHWLQYIKNKFGNLNGIIHCAGQIEDKLLIHKEWHTFQQIMAPKIIGTLILDKLLQNEKLDCFILFSSIASVTGNVGQTDYASANAFMDAFAAWRETQVRENKRFGKTVSINWPLWTAGGMHVNKDVEKAFHQIGLQPLPEDQGLSAFNFILKQPQAQCLVVYGDAQKWQAHLANLGLTSRKEHVPSANEPVEFNENHQVLALVNRDICNAVAQTLKLPLSVLNNDDNLTDYGFDSISFTTLANNLKDHFQMAITPALFYEYSTINQFTQYLWLSQKDKLLEQYQGELRTNASAKSLDMNTTPAINLDLDMNTTPAINKDSAPVISQDIKKRFEIEPTVKIQDGMDDIAIIGMAGVFPQAKNVDELWVHLWKGSDLISEIPKSRWDTNAYENEHIIIPKWSGLIDDIDKFDPEFFSISPREADLMDPQQRLFLQTVWHVIENAGYAIHSLAKTRTGLFVGVSTGDYTELMQETDAEQAHGATGIAHSILVNRISYLLDLHGPSLAIDTACSSSLVALHQAIRAIQSGDCQYAIAGGVNALLSPRSYLSFTRSGMLSPDGRCKTFDKAANGYVRGEGVGAVFLKPLSQAMQDHDRILAVIKASGVNHGGRVNTLTAPNPNAQAELIVNSYLSANISPDSISYIEAHGTGTPLGDPIEINALKKAFNQLAEHYQLTFAANSCALGTVKTNIGHLEAAAGIAGTIKGLLMLKHHQIPPIVNFKELNPYITFDNSPFFIAKEAQEWQGTRPYRIGISSFGFGGTNAHVVLEEAPQQEALPLLAKPFYLVALSAKHMTSLKQRIIDLHDFIQHHSSIPLTTIAYTLDVRRDHFNHRFAVVVASLEELKERLAQINFELTASNENYFYADTERTEHTTEEKDRDKEKLKLIRAEFNQVNLPNDKYYLNLRSLADLYVKGQDIDWSILFKDQMETCTLPNYPFLKKRYWCGSHLTSPSSSKSNQSQIGRAKVQSLQLNPLEEAAAHHAPIRETRPPIKLQTLTSVQEKEMNPQADNLDRMNPQADNLDRKISHQLEELLVRHLYLEESTINPDKPWVEYGVDSILALEIIKDIEKIIGKKVSVIKIYEHPTLRTMTAYLVDLMKESASTSSSDEVTNLANKMSQPRPVNPINTNHHEKYRNAFANYGALTFDQMTIGSLSIETVYAGEGEPVLLLPPGNMLFTAWYQQFAALTSQFKVISFNYPGFGNSSCNLDEMSFEKLSDIIFAILNQLQIKKPIHIVGWSQGSVLARIFALKFPQLVQSLVLVCPLQENIRNMDITECIQILEEDFVGCSNPSTTAINNLLTKFPDASVAYFKEILRFDFQKVSENLTVPTLIIAGDKDKICPLDYTKKLATLITGSIYCQIDGAGHFAPIFNNVFVNNQIAKFITQYASRRKVSAD